MQAFWPPLLMKIPLDTKHKFVGADRAGCKVVAGQTSFLARSA